MAVVRAAFLAWGLFGLSLLAPASASETGAAADALFAQGVAAFQRGDFAAAVAHFERARDAGLHTPALAYNLGASLYKLGAYLEAENAFRTVAEDPAWAALGWYNMALAAHARGDAARARRYAENARRHAEAGEVRALAAALLERLGAGRRSVRGLVQVHLGYDSNVTLTADDQTLAATRISDAFLQLYAAADGHVGGSADAWRWETSLYNVSYEDLSENDITQVLLGASRPARRGDWRWDAGVRLQYLWLDGEGLQAIGTLRLEGTRALADQRELRVAARASTIEAVHEEFEFLEGSRQQLELSLARPAAGGWITTGVSWERNDRRDLAMGSEFFSFSPTRYGLWLAGSWPLGAQWRLEPSALYYRSRYADPDVRPQVTRTRADNHVELSLRLRRPLTPSWQLLAEYAYLDNDSNFSDLSYTQRLMLLGLGRSL